MSAGKSGAEREARLNWVSPVLENWALSTPSMSELRDGSSGPSSNWVLNLEPSTSASICKASP